MTSRTLDFVQEFTEAANKAADNAEAISQMKLLGPLEALLAEVESTRSLTKEDQAALANPGRHAWIQAVQLNANLDEASKSAELEHALQHKSASVTAGFFSKPADTENDSNQDENPFAAPAA